MKEIHFYKTSDEKIPFENWYCKLDNSFKIIVDKRLSKLSRGLYGTFKQISSELYELKFHNGLRIYYTETGKYIVILFDGGDKKDQSKDINKAKEYLKQYKELINDKKNN